MILTANDFLKNYGIWLAVALVVISAVVILILVLQKGKKKIKKGEEISAFLEALGDKENILSVKGIGSRLSLSLQDYDKVNKEKLEQLGVSSFVQMSKKITLVIQDASTLAKEIEAELHQ